MSLMKTVTKMAIGFAMAKGMDAVQKNGGLGELMGGLTGGAGGADGANTAGMGGLSDIMGKLGGDSGAAAGGGGLGGMLSQVTGGAGGGAGGGLGGLLGQLTGGAGGGAAAAGGLGGLGALMGALGGARGGESGAGLEALVNQGNPAQEPDESEVATLMMRAMIQAAQADGEIDAGEKENLMTLLKSGDPDAVETVQGLLSQPVDAAALAADTPQGLETQVYAMSVNAITPDNQAEGQYLHSLGSALGITPDVANQIHDSMGAPRLYS